MAFVNENSTGYLTITFKNRGGGKEAPSSYYYRIDTALDYEVLGWQTGSNPSSVEEITLLPEYNQIFEGNYEVQKNVVTVKAVFGDNDVKTDTFEYVVRNLRQQ